MFVKRTTLLLFVAVASLMPAAPTHAQCGPGGCPVPSRGMRLVQPSIMLPQAMPAAFPIPITAPLQMRETPCSLLGCTNPLCTPNDCANCPNCYYRPAASTGAIAQPGVIWTEVAGQPTQRARWENGRCTGIWDDSSRTFRPCDPSGALGAPTQTPPADLPQSAGAGSGAKPAATSGSKPDATSATQDGSQPGQKPAGNAPKTEAPSEAKTPPTGLDWGQVANYSGGQASRENLYQVLGIEAGSGGEDIPRDTLKPFCAFVSADPAERAEFERLWASDPEFAPWKDRIRCKVHAPDDPILRDRDGNRTWWAEPGFYAVAADGTNPQKIELAMADPETMAGALYRVDPSFSPPNQQPDAQPEQASYLGAFLAVCGLLGAAGIALVGMAGVVGLGIYLLHTPGEQDVVVSVE